MTEIGQGALFEAPPSEATPTLFDRFLVPPFTVLDARQGYWQERKAAWVALGIQPELGRGGEASASYKSQDRLRALQTTGDSRVADAKQSDGVLYATQSVADPGFYSKKRDAERRLGRELTLDEFVSDHYEPPTGAVSSGSSIFDPVLCEIAYRWFCPPGGAILDPFAGELTKGFVAGVLGYPYTGVDLRLEQVMENYDQAERLASVIEAAPEWIEGDSSRIDSILPEGALYDLVFTSPPYYDLEVYSADEADGSAMQTYEEFMDFYGRVFEQSVRRLRDDRFVVVKIGEIRDKKTGVYRNFVGDNISLFVDLGLFYYNEAVLVTSVGSLSVRAARYFRSRKLGKSHQNVLVFYKGDPRGIRDHFPSDLGLA